MSYTATIAARQSQFGVTVVEFNLNGDGRPNRRVAFKLQGEKPDEKELSDVAVLIEERCEAEFQEQLNVKQAPQPTEVELLKAGLMRYSDTAIKEALAIDDAKLSEIKAAVVAEEPVKEGK